jgi:hypothetical protein
VAKSKDKIEQYHLHKDQPEKLQFEIYSLKDYLKKNIGHTDKQHVHSFYQIIWFTKSEGNHYVDFHKYKVIPDTIFFVSKDQIHFFDGNLNYEGVLIHFNDFFLIDNENDIDILLKYNIFNDFEAEPFFKVSGNSATNLRNLLSQMQMEVTSSDKFAHKEYLKHLLKLFLISVQRLAKRNDAKSLSVKNQSHIVFLKFKQLLETHFKEMHTVSEYATLLNISTKTLTNYTNELASKAPLQIITKE